MNLALVKDMKIQACLHEAYIIILFKKNYKTSDKLIIITISSPVSVQVDS